VCLGAQLLAAAGEAKIYPGEAGPEIGWAPITLTSQSADDPLFSGMTPELMVLHWHGDTFDLPRRAVLLASSARYPNQAFRIGPRAWGVQFHLEVDRDAVGRYLGNFGDQAKAVGVPPQQIAAESDDALTQLEPSRRVVLERFAACVREHHIESDNTGCL
jgi:GMP synthase (glutamine-hydrolysing)